ncbi:uncharacterized protein LOC112566841 [Pomacea canaliculata]|uniref:uncharacterized protein LOC112566841 n=1 Tax=Pomacea canaliculata TaxID=400727 RepID=UPI000D72D603|nr:uncharacterized protein LOC112566841 [Pomacea canaliculata]XP_025099019.1 uncharacterized protein LOC112566841 [Pomacea canaliculata]XP_025099020.1 uncharacterized protein LOC112566841 [Pomacea canaliculata]
MDTSWGGRAATLTATVLLLTIYTAAGDVLTACYDGSNKTLTMDCGSEALVRVLKAFYGYSAHGTCHYTEGDCTRLQQQSLECVGRSTCTVPLEGAQQGGVMLPACQKRSNYFQVEYQCVPVREMYDICQHNNLTAQTGHIVTPSYPRPYYSRLHCNLSIVVPPSQKLRVNIITMELASRGKTDCADFLYFNDKFHSLTLCGRRSNVWYDMHSNTLLVELLSTSSTRSPGFWLYYEAFPPLPVTEPPLPVTDPPPPQNIKDSTETSLARSSLLLTSLSTKQVQVQGDITPIPILREEDKQSSTRKASLPFAAIAGGVIGSLSLILIILLTLLFIKWLKERHYFRDEKFLEIRNPAFRSSGDFNEPHTTTYYC